MAGKIQHLVLGRKRWVARLTVPADVRGIIGKSKLSWSTGETDYARASIIAKPVIAQWQEEIAAARGLVSAPGPLSPETTAHLRSLWKAAESPSNERGAPDEVETAIQATTEALVKTLPPDLRGRPFERAVWQNDGDEGAALVSLEPSLGLVIDFLRGDRTPFREYEVAWVKILETASGRHVPMKPRQVKQYQADLKLFAKDHECLQDVTITAVEEWAERRIQAGDSLKTVQRRLAALRNYWGYLKTLRAVDREKDPWANITAGARKKAPKVPRRAAFTSLDAVGLYSEAVTKNDGNLADLILLAAFTGARIEELCIVQARDVVASPDGLPAAINVSSKTEAGRRTIPLVGCSVEVVQRLLRTPQEGGYLIHSTADNQYGERSAPLGKRFGRLKAEQGHGGTLVFHSLRKTVATALHDVGCPEPIAADILGHEINTMSYGVYSTGSAQGTRREWLEKAMGPLEAMMRPLVEPRRQEVQSKPRARKPKVGGAKGGQRDRADGAQAREAKRPPRKQKA